MAENDILFNLDEINFLKMKYGFGEKMTDIVRLVNAGVWYVQRELPPLRIPKFLNDAGFVPMGLAWYFGNEVDQFTGIDDISIDIFSVPSINKLRGGVPGLFNVDYQGPLLVSGLQKYTLGDMKVSIKGAFIKTISNGVAVSRFSGNIYALKPDRFDFNKSTHRSGFREALTAFGAWLERNTIAQPFQIFIEGNRELLVVDRRPVGIRVPVGQVSSGRVPGSRATVASGEELNALDAIAEFEAQFNIQRLRDQNKVRFDAERYGLNRAAAAYFGDESGISEDQFRDGLRDGASTFGSPDRYIVAERFGGSPGPSVAASGPRIDRLMVIDRKEHRIVEFGLVKGGESVFARELSEQGGLWTKPGGSATWQRQGAWGSSVPGVPPLRQLPSSDEFKTIFEEINRKQEGHGPEDEPAGDSDPQRGMNEEPGAGGLEKKAGLAADDLAGDERVALGLSQSNDDETARSATETLAEASLARPVIPAGRWEPGPTILPQRHFVSLAEKANPYSPHFDLETARAVRRDGYRQARRAERLPASAGLGHLGQGRLLMTAAERFPGSGGLRVPVYRRPPPSWDERRAEIAARHGPAIKRAMGTPQEKAAGTALVLDYAAAAEEQELRDREEAWAAATKTDPEIGGAKLEESLRQARLALDRYGDKSLYDYLDDSGLGNHPGLIRMAQRIGAWIERQ